MGGPRRGGKGGSTERRNIPLNDLFAGTGPGPGLGAEKVCLLFSSSSKGSISLILPQSHSIL